MIASMKRKDIIQAIISNPKLTEDKERVPRSKISFNKKWCHRNRTKTYKRYQSAKVGDKKGWSNTSTFLFIKRKLIKFSFYL